MTVYTNFLGIDIGKFNFVVSIYGTKNTVEYENSPAGIGKFLEENERILLDSLSVVETTGGYELEFIYSLIDLGYKVHRADTRKVKNFTRSFGSSAKTDILDAKALAKYAYERHGQLELFKPNCQSSIELFQLVQRRNDLNSMLVAEKNRLQSPGGNMVKHTIDTIIKAVTGQIESITKAIKQIIDNNPELKKKQEILKTIAKAR